MNFIMTNIILGGNNVYIGYIVYDSSIRIHLCTANHAHLSGYYLFRIDNGGYSGEYGIGNYYDIDKYLIRVDDNKLLIAGIDDI
jgi:hypothetical protein